MSEVAAAKALRSDARLVVIEAPAGCGKTFQAASLAVDCAGRLRPGRMLILTHTHAACGVIAQRTRGAADIEIRTIDSLIVQLATAYHHALDLPSDVSAWARQKADGYDHVGTRVAALMARVPSIAASLAHRYPVILCDEHQDSSPPQHAIVMEVHQAGARLRIFGDPMQSIYPNSSNFDAAAVQWERLCKAADVIEPLDVGHRWAKAAPELGEWIQQARDVLRKGGRIDLRGALPQGLRLILAENRSAAPRGYLLDRVQRKPVDGCIDRPEPLLVLAAHNHTVDCLRGVFNRRLPIWEGHTRSALDELVKVLATGAGNAGAVGAAALDFLGEVGVGFGATAFGTRFSNEIATGCGKKCRGRPLHIQGLARHLVTEPDHRGLAKFLRSVEELSAGNPDFAHMKIDRLTEFRDAIQLGSFDNASHGHTEITRRRTHVRPEPKRKTLSTVHKAKGLEYERVLVIPCDAKHFTAKPQHRCLLYVALSRPVRELTLVAPIKNPSPLLLV